MAEVSDSFYPSKIIFQLLLASRHTKPTRELKWCLRVVRQGYGMDGCHGWCHLMIVARVMLPMGLLLSCETLRSLYCLLNEHYWCIKALHVVSSVDLWSPLVKLRNEAWRACFLFFQRSLLYEHLAGIVLTFLCVLLLVLKSPTLGGKICV